jgi:hypothetical protein
MGKDIQTFLSNKNWGPLPHRVQETKHGNDLSLSTSAKVQNMWRLYLHFSLCLHDAIRIISTSCLETLRLKHTPLILSLVLYMCESYVTD